MRHRKHTSKLNRTSEHRAAMMRNLAISLIGKERIRTTRVKAVQLRPFVEGLITVAKEATLADKRLIISRLGDKDTARKLWGELATRIGNRAGGYLRIVRDGARAGDGAPMAWIEFVDQAPAATAEPESLDAKDKLKKKMHERRKEAAKARKAGATA